MKILKVSTQPQSVERITGWLTEEIEAYPGTPADYLAEAVQGINPFEDASIEDFFEGYGKFTGQDLEDENGRIYEEVSFRISDAQRIDGSWWVGGAKFEINLTEYMATMLEHSKRVAGELERGSERD